MKGANYWVSMLCVMMVFSGAACGGGDMSSNVPDGSLAPDESPAGAQGPQGEEGVAGEPGSDGAQGLSGRSRCRWRRWCASWCLARWS